eukprot:GHVR01083407.1.p1 GENE.GHVR01083407.1~~GHVR01083407.1.p1  ORF type:complete len:143 (+),score=2.55 GHVR01083407.1:81-509(+)
MGKFIKTFYLTIAVLSSTVAAQPEWCMAKAEPGKPDFQWCSPKDEMAVEYKIEVTGVAGSGYDTNCDIFLGLNGDTGSSSEVQIASAERGTKQHVSIFDNDLGSLDSVKVLSQTEKNWKCKKITVYQDYRYWTFDCAGVLNS